ncbi:MAG: DNA-directed RNA polymerase, partial [Flavobacteriales bacterium]
RELFSDEDETIALILKTMFFLAGSSSGALDYKSTDKKRTRHKKIKSINEKIFPDLSFDRTWRVVEAIIDFSKYFEIDREYIIINGKFNWSLEYICTIDESIYERLSTQALMAFYPMPMTKEPLDWKFEDGLITGGYEEFQYEMIRTKKKYLNYSKYSQKIYDSLNYIQKQPWKVDLELLKFVENDLRIPVKEDFINTIYPDSENCKFGIKIKEEDHGLSEDALAKVKLARKEFQQTVDLYHAEIKDFESAMGKYRAVKMAVEIAHEYKGKTIYFPHSYDSRGRIYPIPVGLTPQGSDQVKALLKYDGGQVLNRDGAEWAFAYLASLYGDDKLHFEERVQRGMELINADYKDADEPYQFLSHQLELHKIVDDPKASFNGRIHLDACNSGSQFTSALTGDISGCLATNVIPTIREDGLCDRQDAYLLVSKKSIEMCKNILLTDMTNEDREVYELLLKLLEESGRKICKRPVMVSNYGGTSGGRADMLYNMFRELGVPRKHITQPNAIKFAKIIGDSITGVLNGGKAFEKYVQLLNNIISKKGTAVTWTTGDGFKVIHVKNKELKPQKVRLKLPNSRKEISIIKKMYSEEVAPMKMRSAISPNVIHSYDAELLRRVALRMKEEGIESSDWIHDSFGTLPNEVGDMLRITKEVFLEMMHSKPLDRLDVELRAQALFNGTTERQLSKVELPDLNGIDWDGGGINDLSKSEWFFS